MITVIHQRDIIRGVAEKWAFTYTGNYHRWPDKRVIGMKLAALDLETASAQEINDIIGNATWTVLMCTECDQSHSVLVRVGQEPDYDAQWVDLCMGCLQRAARALATAPVKP